MAITEGHASMTCSFCLKPISEVAVGRWSGVHVCDECVDLCREINSDPPGLRPQMTSWEHDLDIDGILASLPRMATAGAQVERDLFRLVRRARELGATWAIIGTSLGMTRQSAWDRFSGEK